MSFFAFLFNATLVVLNSIPDTENATLYENTSCGIWTEWAGDCSPQQCGLCNIQERTREVGSDCQGPTTDFRNCLNPICYFPCNTCAENCQKTVFDDKHVCVANELTANDIIQSASEGFLSELCA